MIYYYSFKGDKIRHIIDKTLLKQGVFISITDTLFNVLLIFRQI